jgi:hypothetical protein
MRRTVRGASVLLAAGMLAVGLGACGDDDGADAGTAEGGDLSTDGASADAAKFCDAAVAVDAANLGLDSGETSPGDVDAALKAAEANAPTEISAAVGTMITEAKAMMAEAESASAEEEGPPPIPSEAFFSASVDVGGYLADNCDFATLDVTATNYKFGGIADSVSAGTTVMTFDNKGTEFHEMALVRIDEGEERSLEELLALPQDEVDSRRRVSSWPRRARRRTPRRISTPGATWRSASCPWAPRPRRWRRAQSSTTRTATTCTAWWPSSRSPSSGDPIEFAPTACAAVPPPRRTLARGLGSPPEVRRDRNRGVTRGRTGVR